MAIGVPEQEVFAAADAVLSSGERPTVERVRQALGRGSPARVGSLLDQWWGQLAGRLRGETRLPGLPTDVAHAFVAVWQQAVEHAQGVAEQALEGQRQVLQEEREALATLEAQARLDVAQARQQVVEANGARQTAETRLVDLEQLLVQRGAQIDDLRGHNLELQQQRDEARQQLIGLQGQLHDSREQAEHARLEQQRYTREVEDRAYREVDRARSEAKTLAAQLKEAGNQHAAAQQALQSVHATLAGVREHLGVATAQRDALQRERDAAEAARDVLAAQYQAGQQDQSALQTALDEAREQATASRVLSELLRQQLAAATEPAPKKRTRTPR